MTVAKRELGRTGLQVTTLGYGAMELRGAPRARDITKWARATDSKVVCRGEPGSRSTAWWIVLRPEGRYQALRLWRTAARLRGLTAALSRALGLHAVRRGSESREIG
jgi:hypothetical protein